LSQTYISAFGRCFELLPNPDLPTGNLAGQLEAQHGHVRRAEQIGAERAM